MTLVNPSNTPPKNTPENAPSVEEVIIARLQEPILEARKPIRKFGVQVVIIAAILLAVMITLAVFRGDITFYLSGAVVIMAAVAVIMQNKNPSQMLEVVLTNLRVTIGKKNFPINELAGFWLEDTGDSLIVNLEPNKRSFLPVSFLYPSQDEEEARDLLLQILPEVEPRENSFGQTIYNKIHW